MIAQPYNPHLGSPFIPGFALICKDCTLNQGTAASLVEGCVRQRTQPAWGFEPHPDRCHVNDLHRAHDKRNGELPFLSRGSGLAVGRGGRML